MMHPLGVFQSYYFLFSLKNFSKFQRIKQYVDEPHLVDIEGANIRVKEFHFAP